MIHKKKAVFFLICLLFSAFGSARFPADATPVSDLTRFPQQVSPYLPENPDEPVISYENQKIYAEEYLRSHFAPWLHEDLAYLDLDEAKILAFQKGAAKRRFFTANGKAVPKAEVDSLLEAGDVAFGQVNQPGIALADADVRILPTLKHFYPSAESARGELGLLRQDVLQNSTLKPGEPLKILHYSKNSAWAFIASGTVVGWVTAAKIAPTDADFTDFWMFSDHAVFIKDNVRVHPEKGEAMFVAKMGTVLPWDGNNIYLPLRGESGAAKIVTYKPAPSQIEPFPVPFTPRNALRAVDALMGEPYGWGGSSGFRDCSAMTRDYLTIFGVWLPRNSGDQAKAGAVIPLKNISVSERIRVIADQGIPFASLIQMPGHIMLYLGAYDGELVVFHNVWGTRMYTQSGKVGRNVVGRAVVSSLYLGSEIANRPKSSLIIDNVTNLSFPVANIW